MPLAYLDCFAGLSGDMFLGALVDLGYPIEALREVSHTLVGDAVQIETAREKRHGISGTRVRVEPTGADHAHRTLSTIRDMIAGSPLDASVREDAIRVFERLGEAEAEVHDIPLERVHFHEVGALDSIVDIVGAVAGIHHLGLAPIVCAPPVVGHGTTRSQHGVIPLPAPATARLLLGVPLRQAPIEGERTTPTGAAIAVTLSESFGPMPQMQVDAIGYGVATADPPELANVLRVLVGRPADAALAPHVQRDTVEVLEAEIDDMNPELFGHLAERLRAEGALDVLLGSVQMKKGRPGTALRVLAPDGHGGTLATLVLAESTTTGVRVSRMDRLKLAREVKTFETPLGAVRVKVIDAGDRRRLAPEYDDLARLAAEHGLPIVEVQRVVLAALPDDA